MNADQKGNLEVWLSRGGGLVGVHSATSSFITTPYFKNALGASFSRHPECQNATFTVLNSNHPSTANIPTRWRFSEEVYNFDSDPRRTNASVGLQLFVINVAVNIDMLETRSRAKLSVSFDD